MLSKNSNLDMENSRETNKETGQCPTKSQRLVQMTGPVCYFKKIKNKNGLLTPKEPFSKLISTFPDFNKHIQSMFVCWFVLLNPYCLVHILLTIITI